MYSHKTTLLAAMLLLINLFTYGTVSTYYVSLQGNDSNPGSETQPFRTIQKAVDIVIAGDTILVRGGTYELINTISITKSGNADNYFTLRSYPGERALLDFSGQSFGGSNRGFMITGSFWHIEGFDIFGAGDNGMKIDEGEYNRIVNCAFYRNRDSGLQMGAGASYNEVINCDSYFNADPTDYGDADGFAAKLDVGVENYFYGCRSWRNCDDGWDGYLRGTNNVSTIIENCWAFENGYFEDGTDPGAQANGNGFKMGGSDTKDLAHNYTLKNCLAFNNKAKGFDQNSNTGSMILYNCTGYNNLAGNYVIYKDLDEGSVLEIKNSVVLGETGNLASFAIQEKNSWLSPFEVSEADFISLDPSAAGGPRKEDGSLPDITFMHLAEGSDLIDAGVDVGLSYNGLAPDLGCFESGEPEPTGNFSMTKTVSCSVYPNPASTYLHFTVNNNGGNELIISIYDLSGRTLALQSLKNPAAGQLEFEFGLDNISNGIYIYRITIDMKAVDQGIFLLEK